MEYSEKNIKDGIKLHTINTDKFKTNLIAIFLTTKLDRKEITKNAKKVMLKWHKMQQKHCDFMIYPVY